MIKVNVPGSTMLMGEHAVVYGYPALVAAVSSKISARLMPRDDDKIVVNSYKGKHETSIKNIVVEAPYEFVLSAINQYTSQISEGFDLLIDSQCEADKGFGTSAAVTVAVVALLRKWLGLTCENEEIYSSAYQAVLDVQNVGSGADVAASVYGGVIKYSNQPLHIAKIEQIDMPISLLYCGYKTPTAQVVEQVSLFYQANKKIVENIFSSMQLCVVNAWDALQGKNYKCFGEIANIHQGLQASLGVNTLELAELIFKARKQKDVLGAKISGSGLGDCVIVFGELGDDFSHDARYNMNISNDGLVYES